MSVVGDDTPTEIHVVSSSGRPAKQVVRDVQSLAAARFGIRIDHRIVSVVQLDEKDAQSPDSAAVPRLVSSEPQNGAAAPAVSLDHARPVLENVVVSSGANGWVKVVLKWGTGETTEGESQTGMSRESRARGASAAVIQALQPVLDERSARAEVDQVMLHRVGAAESVLVGAIFFDRGGGSTPLVGSAIIYDDVATAAARALLHAVNRKLAIS